MPGGEKDLFEIWGIEHGRDAREKKSNSCQNMGRIKLFRTIKKNSGSGNHQTRAAWTAQRKEEKFLDSCGIEEGKLTLFLNANKTDKGEARRNA